MGRQFPPAGGTGLAVRRPMGAAFRAREFRRSASLFLGVRRVRNRQFGTTVRRDAPRGNAPPRFNNVRRRNDDTEVCADDSPPSWPGLSRACRPLFGAKAWMPATSAGMTNVVFWRNEPEVFGSRTVFWRNEPESGSKPRPAIRK